MVPVFVLMHPILTFLVISKYSLLNIILLIESLFTKWHHIVTRSSLLTMVKHGFSGIINWLMQQLMGLMLDVLLLFGRSWKKCGQQYNLADSLFWIFGRSLFTLVGCSHNASCQQTMWQGRKSRNQWRLLSQSLNLWWSRGTILRLWFDCMVLTTLDTLTVGGTKLGNQPYVRLGSCVGCRAFSFFWITGRWHTIRGLCRWSMDSGLNLLKNCRMLHLIAPYTTMFLRVWNAVMKSRGQHISKKLMRPSFSVIACWVMSYMPWPSARLDELDRKLLTFFGRQVVKCTDLTRLCLDHLVWWTLGAATRSYRSRVVDQTKWDKVVSNIFHFHPYLGKIPILTNIFQMGWNHQPVIYLQPRNLKNGYVSLLLRVVMSIQWRRLVRVSSLEVSCLVPGKKSLELCVGFWKS